MIPPEYISNLDKRLRREFTGWNVYVDHQYKIVDDAGVERNYADSHAKFKTSDYNPEFEHELTDFSLYPEGEHKIESEDLNFSIDEKGGIWLRVIDSCPVVRASNDLQHINPDHAYGKIEDIIQDYDKDIEFTEDLHAVIKNR